MTFRKTVLAYLTGWLIVQPLYNRLLKAWRKRELRNPSDETMAYFETQAVHIVDELERRRDIREALGLARNHCTVCGAPLGMGHVCPPRNAA